MKDKRTIKHLIYLFSFKIKLNKINSCGIADYTHLEMTSAISVFELLTDFAKCDIRAFYFSKPEVIYFYHKLQTRRKARETSVCRVFSAAPGSGVLFYNP